MRRILPAVLLVGSLSAACGASSPMAASSPTPAIWVLSGQSNAREVRPALNLEAARVGAIVTGWAEGGDYISAWAETGAGWLGWVKPALEQPGVQAFIWSHGETDAGSTSLTAAYPAALAELFSRVRSVARQPALRVVLVELSQNTNYAAMRVAQKAYVTSDPYARLVNTEDIPDNGGHFFADGYTVIAQRIAQAVR